MTTTHNQSCACPVHRDGDPPTYPLGISFAEKLAIEGIPQHIARDIYAEHHSYRPETPNVNLTHHGVFLDGHLVGSITYRFPLIRRLGDVPGDKIVEVARICIAVEMPNLASAAFARSQDIFIRAYARPNGIRVLLTFVHEDYEGSMLRALRGLGWYHDGIREGKQAGNRPETDIRDADKARWVRELETETTQTTFEAIA